MDLFDKGLVTVLACCGLFVLVAIPLVLRRVPRNRVYGYRTCATLKDDATWYEANAHFGSSLIFASALTAVVAVLLHRWQGLSPDLYMKATVVLLAAPGLVAWMLTARLVARRAKRK